MSIRVIQFGLGNWGRNINSVLKRALCKNDHQKVIAVDPFSNEAAKSIQDIEKEQLNEIKYAFISTPSKMHLSIAMMCLSKGWHCFVEKPMVMSIADLDVLEREAQQRSLKLMSGHLMLYHQELVLGLLGFLKNDNIEITRIDLKRGSTSDIVALSTSSTQQDHVLWDLGPHDISIMLLIQVIMDGKCNESIPSLIYRNLDPIHSCAVFEMNNFPVIMEWSRRFDQKTSFVKVTSKRNGCFLFDDTEPSGRKCKIDGHEMDTLKQDPESSPLDIEIQEALDFFQDKKPSREFIEYSRKVPTRKVIEIIEMLLKS